MVVGTRGRRYAVGVYTGVPVHCIGPTVLVGTALRTGRDVYACQRCCATFTVVGVVRDPNDVPPPKRFAIA